MSTAGCHEWNAVQAVRTITSGWRSLYVFRLVASHERVHWTHNKEVDHECHDEECDKYVDESAYIEDSLGVRVIGRVPCQG